ncbi:MAG: gamma-glutamyltransferase [Calditrichaeota bacterium]|nr:MAG: gamma-glutamyltransferase [Calditrichota bacterium]
MRKSGNSHLLCFILFLFFLQIQTTLLGQGRRPVRVKNGMVVSTSRYASEIGKQVLTDGGNAIDAAVATAFALAVTWPSAGNLGGGGFLVYHRSDGDVTTFDFREKAPLVATERMFLSEDGKIRNASNHEGILAVGVPGTVAGLYAAHKKYGNTNWKKLVEPAYKLAKKGFPLTWGLHDGFKYHKDDWLQYPSSTKIFLKPDSSLYQPGERWVQRDHAATLKRIMKKGRDGFYKGKTADLIMDYMQKHNGLITHEDLEKYQPVEREPVHGTYRDFDIYAMGPPSSGGVVLAEMLNILEGYDLAAMGHNSAKYLHFITEAMRRAYADRARYLGDPDFSTDMPLAKLLSKEYAAYLRTTISETEASISDSITFNDVYESPETTHFSVIDASGNMVSLTYTLEYPYGSRMIVEGAGFLLNNEMGDFNPMPGTTDSRGYIGTEPNLIEPEKRMLSSMTPTIVAKNGIPIMAVGSPGGRTIINTVLQVVLNVLEFDMNIAKAVEAPRIHHQWLPDVTRMEDWGFSPDTQRLYKDYGHNLKIRWRQGAVMGIYKNTEEDIIYGASDSRSSDGAAVGY